MRNALRTVLWLSCACCALVLPARAELPDATAFSVALELGDVDQAREWLDAGLSPDFEGQRIGTGLMIGAWEGNVALLELFAARGAHIDQTNRFGETALMLAAWKNQPAALRWLLDHGARPNRGEREWTPLHYAVFAGHLELADTLLRAGADVNARSTNGSTVIMMAAREGHAELAERLIAAGADPWLKNDYGDDAVSWAMRQQNFDIARRLGGVEKFATLAREASSAPPPPPPQRSKPVPDEVDDLLRKARLAEQEGKHSLAKKMYKRAWMELEMAEAPRRIRAEAPAAEQASKQRPSQKAKTPQAVEIRARRAQPAQQSLSIRYRDEAADTDAGKSRR